MRWEWDSGGDSRVPLLWHLREELSRSKKVVYCKWYRGRATFFSRDTFVNFLSVLQTPKAANFGVEARKILEALELESPLSTKQLKRSVGLVGKDFEAAYNRGLNELWRRLWIVGFGEIDDGAFPSLAIGSTEVLFEDLVRRAREVNPAMAWENLQKKLGPKSLFLKNLTRGEGAKPRRTSSRRRGNILFGWGGLS